MRGEEVEVGVDEEEVAKSVDGGDGAYAAEMTRQMASPLAFHT